MVQCGLLSLQRLIFVCRFMLGDAVLKFVLSLAAVFSIFAVGRDDAAQAHHSWKCPPEIDAKVVSIEDGRFELAVTARNTCGCKIKFVACPAESEGDDAQGCQKAWVDPGGYFRRNVLTGSSGKARYDWRTHSNDAPCT